LLPVFVFFGVALLYSDFVLSGMQPVPRGQPYSFFMLQMFPLTVPTDPVYTIAVVIGWFMALLMAYIAFKVFR